MLGTHMNLSLSQLIQFINLFHKHSLSAYYMPGMAQGSGVDTIIVDKTQLSLCLAYILFYFCDTGA
jgi:hypothetical protein